MKIFYHFDGLHLTQNKQDYISDYIGTTSKRKGEMHWYIELISWYQVTQNLNELVTRAVRSNNAKVE